MIRHRHSHSHRHRHRHVIVFGIRLRHRHCVSVVGIPAEDVCFQTWASGLNTSGRALARACSHTVQWGIRPFRPFRPCKHN